MQSLKCVTVGDGAVGKTCMLMSYSMDAFPEDYVPTVFENYTAMCIVDGRPLSLDLWDTVGQEDYDRLRPLSYTCTDVFVVCYSVTSPSSLRNVKDKWIKEIRSHCPHAPIVLAGTKADLRNLSAADKQDITFVDFADAKELGEELGVDRVMECSAKTGVGLTELFNEVMKVGLAAKSKSKIKKRKKCVLL